MDTLLTPSSGNEWRLLHAVALNAIVLICLFRFVRRRTPGDALAAVPWALLGWFLVQYLSVTLPGLVGLLNRWTMSAVALGISGLLYLMPQPQARPEVSSQSSALDRHVLWLCILFFAGYLIAIISNQRLTPAMSDDALTYHLPAAVRWLQTGRLVLHDVWFFNPANTYSPLAGSTFAAWWMAPLGNDYLARLMQVPGLVLIFFAMLQLGRAMGAPLYIAAPLALATVLSRPFVSQVILAKDDLFLAGFFAMAVLGGSRELLGERMGAWRVGVALGLFLATKITALLALPLLLLMVDGPIRAGWRWREWAVMGGVVLVLAGPWFIRNLWLTGNPIFPVEVAVGGHTMLSGLFRAERSLELRSFMGVWRMVTGSYFSIPPIVLGMLILTSAGTLATVGRPLLAHPQPRLSLLGPPLGLAIFALAAPFPEVRFLDPSFLLLFASVAVLAARWNGRIMLGGTLALAGLSIGTGFIGQKSGAFALVGAGVAAVAPLGVCLEQRWPGVFRRLLGIAMGVAGVLLGMGAYVYQDALINEYAQATPIAWESQYGALGEMWTFVRGKVPGDKAVAYANTYLTYPLFGFDGSRRVVYAPVRKGVAHLHDLPRLEQAIPGERLREVVKQVINEEADRGVWVENLRRVGAEYLVIGKDGGKVPPELGFVGEDRAGFVKVFENEAGVVYRIGGRV